MSSPLLDVLLAELDEQQLRRLAVRLAPYLAEAGPAPHELLTADEAAVLLRCKRKRLYELVQRGSLPAQRDGARLLIRRADLDDYLADRTEAA